MIYRKLLLFSKFKNASDYVLKRHLKTKNIMTIVEKNLINDIFPTHSSNEITNLCNAGPQCVYAGFDPTADSLHVGNLLVLMNLLHWHRGGHEVIALIGGATGRIGDPSGRNTERDEQSEQITEQNVKCIAENIKRIFDNHSILFKPKDQELIPIKIVDNCSWFKKKNVIEFICGVGRHFRMGTMLSRNAVATRMRTESGMSFAEFSYQIFQAYDWFHLLTQCNCRFQVGGSDQMGNIMAGQELISRILGKPVYGLTVPLITSETGDKFGKSSGNAVWLSTAKTPPFELYQFFIRTADAQVKSLIHQLTFATPESVEKLYAKQKERPEKRLAQKFLAEQVTLLVHGEEGLASALRTSTAMYSADLKQITNLNAEEVAAVFQGAQIVDILLRPGITVKQCALAAKCFISEEDADRIISAGGFYINYNRTKNPNELLLPGVHILPNYVSLLRVGKKNYSIVRWLK